MHFSNSNIQSTVHFSTRFLRMNTDSWVNSTILILLALNTRINYEWLFQNLRTKYKSVGWNLSDGRNAHEHSTLINLYNSAFWSKSIIEVVLEKYLIHWTSTGYRLYKHSFASIPSYRFLFQKWRYFSEFKNLNTWFLIVAFCQAI